MVKICGNVYGVGVVTGCDGNGWDLSVAALSLLALQASACVSLASYDAPRNLPRCPVAAVAFTMFPNYLALGSFLVALGF